MGTIISKSNEKVKLIKSLNEKKYRTKNHAFYLEGVKVVNEILDRIEAIDIMFIAYSKSILLTTNGGEAILNRINNISTLPIYEIAENIFKDITDTVNPQGILAVVKIPKCSIDDILNSKSNNNIIVLDKVQDMGNIGTIIRSCNAFEVDTIICTSGTADAYSPKVIRSTMGGILKVKICYLENIEELKKLKEIGYKIVTTSLDTDTCIDVLNMKEKYAFAMGNEANGVSKEVENLSDILVKIPMSENMESLNVGVATSIVLYEQFKSKKII